MKIQVNGWARHGKDTVGDYFAERYDLRKNNASIVIAEMLFELLPNGWYKDFDECYADRVNHREGWYNFIVDGNHNPTQVERAMVDGDIFTGERHRKSFERHKHMFDVTIWVDSSARGIPPEPMGSCDLNSAGHDLILFNNGTLRELYDECDLIYNKLEKQ